MDTLHRADKVNSVMKPNAQPFENNKNVTLNRLQVNLCNKDGHRTLATSHLTYPPKQRLEGIYCTNNSAGCNSGKNDKSMDPVIKMLHNVKLSDDKYMHKLLIFGDSILRGSAGTVRTLLSEKYSVLSVNKPGADFKELTQSLKNEVLGSGSNNCDRYKLKTALKLIVEFLKTNNHTNIVLLSIPHRYDLQKFSYMNKQIMEYNRKLSKIARAYNHVQFSDVDINRNLYTKQGLCFNKFGKVQLAKQLVSLVQLMFGKKTDLPMALGWPIPLLINSGLVTVVSPTDIVEVQCQSAHVDVSIKDSMPNRTVKRKRKFPCTRTNDFLW
jgi:hypothetical protein